MAIDDVLARLTALPAPADAEHLYDERSEAARLRLRNLRHYLDLVAGARLAFVAEAPGWRGMTITGVPFLSVREIDQRPGLITGDADGDGFERPSDPAADWEASSRVVWAALDGWRGPLPVSWPIYPHHPFLAPDRHSNRTPRAAEVALGAPLAVELVRALGVERVAAVGRKAEAALARAGVSAIPVRHPAQGGAARFTLQVRELGRAE